MDFIEVYDNAVTPIDCQSIIKYFEARKQSHKRGTIGPKGKLDRKKKDTWELPDTKFSNMTSIEKALYQGIVYGTKEYMKKYPAIVGHLASWNVENGFNLQKYNPKCAYFVPHCEHSSITHGHRMLVWMIYLNTVTDGGGTKFTCYDREVNAVEGRLVIWPSGWTHTHHGVVSNTQSKYIATGWYAFKE